MSLKRQKARPEEEDGFEGAWFKAILVDFPKKSAGRKVKVRYLDLKAEDGSRRFVRPVPPENLFSTGDFEEGSVLEAFHGDGWWNCVFVKKLEEDKHLVYFESPPDLIHFKRKQLRQHFDWIKEKWVNILTRSVRGFSLFFFDLCLFPLCVLKFVFFFCV